MNHWDWWYLAWFAEGAALTAIFLHIWLIRPMARLLGLDPMRPDVGLHAPAALVVPPVTGENEQ